MENLMSIFEERVKSIKGEQTRVRDIEKEKVEIGSKCLDMMCEKLSFINSLGFTIKKSPSNTDDYGKPAPRIYLYFNNKYFCFIEPPYEQIKDEEDRVYYIPSIENSNSKIGSNDLFRYLKPNGGLTYENFAKCLADILYK